MKKIIIVLFFIIGLAILDACQYVLDCDCATVQPYYNYLKLRADIYVRYGNFPLRFNVYPDDFVYIASTTPSKSCNWNGFTTAAYGCDCLTNGYNGSKTTVDSIDIVADKPFSANAPAGASLHNYFKLWNQKLQVELEVDPNDLLPLDQINTIEALKHEFVYLGVGLVQEPDSIPIEGFVFTITCYKSDGSTASITTPATRW